MVASTGRCTSQDSHRLKRWEVYWPSRYVPGPLSKERKKETTKKKKKKKSQCFGLSMEQLRVGPQSGSQRLILQLPNFTTGLQGGKTNKGSCMRLVHILFFSRAFNTVQPHLPVQKLVNIKLPSSVVLWIFDYLT